MNSIHLNGQSFSFSENELPMLIHGEHKAGSSLFTVTVAANLFAQGSSILFLSGYHMARDEFFTQIQDLPNKESIFFYTKEELDKFLQALSETTNRVVIVKNIELFTEEIFDLVVPLSKVIVSGDINQCSFKQKILDKGYISKVFFSPLEGFSTPALEKYEGYLLGSREGVVTTAVS